MHEDKDLLITNTGGSIAMARLKPSITTSDVFVDDTRSCKNFEKSQSKRPTENFISFANRVFPDENVAPKLRQEFSEPSTKSTDFLATTSAPKEDSFEDFVFSKQKQGFHCGFPDRPKANNKIQVKKVCYRFWTRLW